MGFDTLYGRLPTTRTRPPGAGRSAAERLVGKGPRVRQPDLDPGRLRPVPRRPGQVGLERRVDLEGDQAAGARGEGPGQHPRPRPDLAHDVGGRRADGLHDAGRDARIAQEVLAERATAAAGRTARALARPGEPGGHGGGRPAASRARCSATRAAWTARTWAAVSSGDPELSTT